MFDVCYIQEREFVLQWSVLEKCIKMILQLVPRLIRPVYKWYMLGLKWKMCESAQLRNKEREQERERGTDVINVILIIQNTIFVMQKLSIKMGNKSAGARTLVLLSDT